MNETLLEVENLTIQYQTDQGMLTAVSDASFSIEKGEYFGLVGESGCGKTTLAKALLGGLDQNGQISSGKLIYKGEEIQGYSDDELNDKIRWKEIAFIPQGSMNSLDPLEKISDQAWKIADVHTDMDREEAMEKFEEMFEIVGLQKNRIHDYPHQFSGGMQQRAIIALVLFLDPDLIVADEPTTALDVIMQDQIFKYLDQIREETDTSMLLITHDISVVLESCGSIAIMHSGQIAETGSTIDLYEEPHHPYSILLQEAFPDHRYPNRELGTIDGYPPQTIGEVSFCTFADRCPWAVEECTAGHPPLEPITNQEGAPKIEHKAACIRRDEVRELYEQEYQDSFGKSTSPESSIRYQREQVEPMETTGGTSTLTGTQTDDEVVLEVDNLKKYFMRGGGIRSLLPGYEKEPIKAVDDVSFSLERNDSIGVIGESGCGKTTLLMTLMGLHELTDGDIRINGKSMSQFTKADWKAYRRQVQIIFQDPFNSLDPKMSVYGTLIEPLKIHNMDNKEQRIHDVLEQVELRPPEQFMNRRPHQLSGGEKQRVSIARALILEPEVILADEPVSMLDVSTQASILRLLSRLMDDTGVSMVYISHDLSTVSYVCDRINVMYLGRFVEQAPTETIIEDPQHPYSQALMRAIPVLDPEGNRERTEMEGAPRDPIGLGEGCRFRDRCPDRMDICEKSPLDVSVEEETGVPNHIAACHLYYEHDALDSQQPLPEATRPQ